MRTEGGERDAVNNVSARLLSALGISCVRSLSLPESPYHISLGSSLSLTTDGENTILQVAVRAREAVLYGNVSLYCNFSPIRNSHVQHNVQHAINVYGCLRFYTSRRK